MIASGEAGRFLTTAEFRHAQNELLNSPLDYEAIRFFVHAVASRDRAERNGVLGIVGLADKGRWRCQSLYCRDKSRWWMSDHGVVNCRNCVPPSFPEWVIIEGEAKDAPFVEPGRSNQAREPFPRRRPSISNLTDPTSSAAIDAPIPCVSTL